jgi:hypothetical protein
MASVLGMTNEGTPFPGEPFVFPSYRNVGPPYIATLSLPGLTIRLPVWLFSTLVISNAGTSDVSTPPAHQTHVDLYPSSLVRSPSISPSSPSESSKASSQVDKKKKKHKEKKKNQTGTKPPTTSDVGSKKPTIFYHNGSVDAVDKIKTNNMKPKFPCSLCKVDHFMRYFHGIPKILEIWSSMSSAPTGHDGDTLSTSDVKVGKNKKTVKFPCMLCKGGHYSHFFPCMDEASSILEKIQLPTGYRKISPNPSLVDGLVNPVPSLVNLVDQVVNIVSSLIEPKTQLVDPVPSSINPTLHQKSEAKVVDLVSPSVDPTPPLRSAKVVNPVPSIDPTPPLKSAKVVDLVTSSVNPTPPLKSAKVVDLVPP